LPRSNVENEEFAKRKAEMVKRNPIGKSLLLKKSRDADYFLESVQYKLEDLHNCYLAIQRQLDYMKEQLKEISRSQRKWKNAS